jgi:hypothetical protein
MPKQKFLIWSPKYDPDFLETSDESDAYESLCEHEAVEKWAEQFDSYDGEYPIAAGEEVIVNVKNIKTGKTKNYEVTGEFDPVYYVYEIKDKERC